MFSRKVEINALKEESDDLLVLLVQGPDSAQLPW